MSIPKDVEKLELWKEKQSLAHKGQIPWNKGKKGKQSWHDLSGLHSHKKGEFKHSEITNFVNNKRDQLGRFAIHI